MKAKPPAKAKSKAPAKPKPPELEPPSRSLDGIDINRANTRLKVLREKLGKAIDNPDVREQMVRYLQGLLRDDGQR